MSVPQRIRVVIPHYFDEGPDNCYGSGRKGNRLPRSLALARSLGSLLALNRAPQDWILNIAQKRKELTPLTSLTGLQSIHVDLHLFVANDSFLQDVVELFRPRITVHHLQLDNPRDLPLEAARCLLDMSSPADLSIYLEDDLIFNDNMMIDKLFWFYQRTDHQFVLMPHRYEVTVANAPKKFFVDGPIRFNQDSKPVWSTDEKVIANGRFWDGSDVDFVVASNPHSGFFCLSYPQLAIVKDMNWPPKTFIGPLETAATGTVLGNFPVLKPSWPCRSFLSCEHGHPSFLSYLGTLPDGTMH